MAIKPKAEENSAVIALELQPFTEVTVPIEGTAPLIVHNWSEKTLIELLRKRLGKGLQGKVPRDPEQEYKDSMYLFPDGSPGMHAGAFKAALIRTIGTLYPKNKELSMIAARGLIQIHAEFVPVSMPALFKLTDEATDDTLYARTTIPLVRIKGEPVMRQDLIRVETGQPDFRWRAEYFPWSADLHIGFTRLTAAQVFNLVDQAGAIVGVGEMRPTGKESSGSFGTFKVAR